MKPGDCVPVDKFDEAAIKRASCLGFPALNAVLPELLEWLQDANWPIAGPVASLLSQAGTEIAPHIGAVLRSNDGTWKYWILTMIGADLDPAVRRKIRSEVERIASAPSADDRAEEADIAAREVLARWAEQNPPTE